MDQATVLPLFVTALRKNYRFQTSRSGLITVEDLWSLPLQSKTNASLNGVAIILDTQLQQTKRTSFVDDSSSENVDLQNKFNIVLYIIDVKKAELAAAANAAAQRRQNEKVMEIISRKQDQDLENKSIEELQSMLAKSAS